MSKNDVDSNKETQRAVVQAVSVSSPLPPPEWMEKYNNVDSNIIKEILEQYRDNGKVGRDVVLSRVTLVKTSQWHGFIATILIIAVVALCAYLKQEKIALGLLSLSFIGAVKALIRKN
jgi:uncharacterized membrane protein